MLTEVSGPCLWSEHRDCHMVNECACPCHGSKAEYEEAVRDEERKDDDERRALEEEAAIDWTKRGRWPFT